MSIKGKSRHARIHDLVCLLLAFLIIVPAFGAPFAQAAVIVDGTADGSGGETLTPPPNPLRGRPRWPGRGNPSRRKRV